MGGVTNVRSKQIFDGGVKRQDLNSSEAGSAVIKKVIAGDNIVITETGADSGTGDVTISTTRRKQYTQIAGKFDLFSNNNWSSWSDPVFGFNQQDFDLTLGNGGIPNVDWDGLGLSFPAGARLKRAFVKCRGNNNDIDQIETFVRMHDVDLTAGDAIDSIAEIGAVTIQGATLVDLDAGLGVANDMRSFEIDLNDYDVVNDGADLHIIVRAQSGTLNANRQLRVTIFVEWELPL